LSNNFVTCELLFKSNYELVTVSEVTKYSFHLPTISPNTYYDYISPTTMLAFTSFFPNPVLIDQNVM